MSDRGSETDHQPERDRWWDRPPISGATSYPGLAVGVLFQLSVLAMVVVVGLALVLGADDPSVVQEVVPGFVPSTWAPVAEPIVRWSLRAVGWLFIGFVTYFLFAGAREAVDTIGVLRGRHRSIGDDGGGAASQETVASRSSEQESLKPSAAKEPFLMRIELWTREHKTITGLAAGGLGFIIKEILVPIFTSP